MHLDQTGNNVVIIATFHAAHARGCLRAVSVVLLATVFTASNSTHRNHEQAPDQGFIPLPAAPVMLDRVSIGTITERSVPALVAQGAALRSNLLGMSFLNRLQSWEVRGDRLVLRGYP